MTIGSHNSEVVGCEVEVHAAHHRTNLVLSCSEERAREILCEESRIHNKRCHLTVKVLHHREVVGRQRCQLERTVEIVDDNREVVLVYIEAERLLGQLLHSVEDGAVGKRKLAVARALGKLYSRLHHVLRIAGSYSQNVVCYFKKETIKNAQSVLAVDNSCEGLETAVKRAA